MDIKDNNKSNLQGNIPQTTRLAQTNIGYHVNNSVKVQQVRRKKLSLVIKMQVLFLIITVVLYCISFPVKYLLVNAQSHQILHCKKQYVRFNGWHFNYLCEQCEGGYEPTRMRAHCVSIQR